MLPVVHLIPQLSALKQNGLDFETPHSLTITFVKEKKEWVVETDLSYVGSPDLKSCTKKCITIPSDGGSFLLHMSRWKEPRIFADCKCNPASRSCSLFLVVAFSPLPFIFVHFLSFFEFSDLQANVACPVI
jgi:hypothetical protein